MGAEVGAQAEVDHRRHAEVGGALEDVVDAVNDRCVAVAVAFKIELNKNDRRPRGTTDVSAGAAIARGAAGYVSAMAVVIASGGFDRVAGIVDRPPAVGRLIPAVVPSPSARR